VSNLQEFKTLGEKVTSDGKLSSRVVIAKVTVPCRNDF